MPKSVSIITPCFKSVATIGRAISSIDHALKHIGDKREALSPTLVVVLDGPDEETLGIVRNKTTSFPVKVIELAQHSGIAAARNAGALQTESDVITFLDADDEMTPSRLAAVTSLLPGTLIIGKQEIVFDGPEKKMLPALPDSSTYHLSSMLIYREDFMRLGMLNEEFSVGDDWDFAIRAQETGISTVKSNQTFVVRHATGMNTSLDREKVKGDYVSAVRKHITRIQEG